MVTEYFKSSGLQKDLDKLGFDLVGYGCTTCIGNSGPLPEPISETIHKNDLVAAAVLSGNRNFEGRVNPDVRANYLASPPLVVAYALGGLAVSSIFANDPIGHDRKGTPVYLQGDLADARRKSPRWCARTSPARLSPAATRTCSRAMPNGARSRSKAASPIKWSPASTYVQNPPYFDGMTMTPEPVDEHRQCAHPRPLPRFDHHRPYFTRRQSSRNDSPAGNYLIEHQVPAGRFQLLWRAARQS